MHTAPGERERSEHIRWLLELTAIPTAAGREHRVMDWIRRWVAARPDIRLESDAAGNMVLKLADEAPAADPLLFITAHLDHPAFVIDSFIGEGTVNAGFRGGVLDPYFTGAGVSFYPDGQTPVRGKVIESRAREPWRQCVIDLADPAQAAASGLKPGDMGRWDLPDPEIRDGQLHTHACDDLAAVAAALAALDVVRVRSPRARVRLLFTRAEEVGFIGAIAACRRGTMPKGSRVIALENSRSFPLDSPIGGGVIIRVGDRLSTFSPRLTGACVRVAELLAKQRSDPANPFRWQRKLMAGGACEASCFMAHGYESTCICLPLGNYHNMADLERVQAGQPEAVAGAKVAHEFISIADFTAMIDLLAAIGTSVLGEESSTALFEKLYDQRAFVLE